MFSGFQSSGFQNNAFQIVRQVKTAVGKLKKKLRHNTRVKAQADRLAEQYKKLLVNEAELSTAVIEKIVAPFIEGKPEDYYQLPKVEAIDFEALARNAEAKKEFNQAVKAWLEEEQEQMVLIIILAAL